MIPSLLQRLVREVDPRLLARCAWSLGVGGVRSIRAFQRRQRVGRQFPAFLFLSVTDQCNLRCQGCWVTPTRPNRALEPELIDRIITQAKREQCRFFGILGGEPLLHPQLLEVLRRHRDCYFRVFTNGTLLSRDVAHEMRRMGNITPLVSVEGGGNGQATNVEEARKCYMQRSIGFSDSALTVEPLSNPLCRHRFC